jgi:hypothetical protein
MNLPSVYPENSHENKEVQKIKHVNDTIFKGLFHVSEIMAYVKKYWAGLCGEIQTYRI